MTLVMTDSRCLDHGPFSGFPERPRRLTAILEHLEGAGFPVHRSPGGGDGAGFEHPDARERVEELHDPDYVERFEHAVARGDGLLDSADNPLSSGSADAAWAAVSVTLAAADRTVAGQGPVFAAVRPPGHHAEHDRAMGFCFFCNVALAAQHLLRAHGLERVGIFDFDVHHGNGTQHLFEERDDVFYASTHQYPFYPGTGAASETGRGPGEGTTLNVPLPAGTGDEGYREAIRGEVLPALEEYAPQALLLSAGFDAWQRDPLGGMRVTEEGYRDWGRWCGELAGRSCEGRVLVALEGGYDVEALGPLAEAVLRGLEEGLR